VNHPVGGRRLRESSYLTEFGSELSVHPSKPQVERRPRNPLAKGLDGVLSFHSNLHVMVLTPCHRRWTTDHQIPYSLSFLLPILFSSSCPIPPPVHNCHLWPSPTQTLLQSIHRFSDLRVFIVCRTPMQLSLNQ
jgi:hypothetical protein